MPTTKKSKKELLRQRAEKLLSKRSPIVSKIEGKDVKKLVHELQVHQIELEMQNEELRKAQAEIEESRTKYSDLYDFSPIGYFTFSQAGEIVEGNLTGASLLGIDRGKLLHRSFSTFVDPEFQSYFRDHRFSVLKNGTKERCELKLIKNDGNPFYASLESIPVSHDRNHRIRSAVSDITELRKAQEKAETEHAFRIAIENSILSGIAAVDLEGRQSYVNIGFCRMVGRSEEELVGRKPPFAYWPPEELDHINKAFRLMMNSKVPLEGLELRFMRKNGERFDVLTLASQLKDLKGNVIGWIGTFGDITHLKQMEKELKQLNTQLEQRVRQRTAELETTNQQLEQEITERKRMEEELRKREEDLNHAQAVAQTGSWRLDVQRNQLLWSDETHRIFGIPKETSLTYEAFLATVHPEDRQFVDKSWQAALRGEPYDIEHRILVEGKIKWVHERAELEFDKEGSLVGGFGTVQDITERKWMEEELRRSRIELEIRVQERTAQLQQTNERLKEENQERIRFEQSLRLEGARLDALLHLSQISEASLKEITGFTLEHAIGLTRSKIGFVGFVNEDESVYTLHAVSKDVVKECDVTGDPVQWHVVDAGIWAEAIRERKTLFVNDYGQPHPRKKGLPAGHPYVERFMVVPISEGERIVAVAGVGNKASEYDKSDERQILLLLSGMWGYVQKNRSTEELKKAYNELEERNEELRAEITERKRAEEALRRMTHDLNERIKEINCLYSISYYIDKQYLRLEEKLKNIVDLIPSGWQYPEITCARIILEDKEYKTDNFKETPWKQSSDIIVHDKKTGRVEVAYLEKKPEDYEGPFLKEERGLINAIAIELGEMIGHKRAEEAVKAERQRFQDVLEILPAYLVLLTPDYHVPFANRFFREHFGESHGRRCFEYLFGRNEPCETCETYTVLKTMAPHRWEWTGPDGHNYDVFDFPFTDSDGSILILEMGIDITERKRAEEALRTASLYTRSLIEASLDPVVTISADGKITDVNKATELVTGVSREQLIGTDFSSYFTEPDKAREGYQRVFLQESVRDYPLTIHHVSGEVTDVLYHATVYKNEVGEIQGVFAAARDITERKRVEETLRESENRLRSLSSQLLTVQEAERKRISREIHDSIGQTLSAIKFGLESKLGQMGKGPAPPGVSLESIISLAQNGIEECRRIQMDLRPSILDDIGILATIGWFTREFQKVYSRISIEKKIQIDETEVPDSLKTVLFRVMQEAMNNIAKHSKADLAHLSLRKADGKIELIMEDNGMGFDLENCRKGLGLTSMRERIELSGGSFAIESTPGKGTIIKALWPT
jgi:PAS domain S-box-containing protein